MENPSLMKSKLCYQSEKENLDLSLKPYLATQSITTVNSLIENYSYINLYKQVLNKNMSTKSVVSMISRQFKLPYFLGQ